MVNPYRYYTYAYLRIDRTPYYIGKGEGKRLYTKGKDEIGKPPTKDRIIFLKQNLTEAEAFRHEIYMIAVYGRKDLETGILRNKTNGGEGTSGFIPWNKGTTYAEDLKKKISIGRKGIPSNRPGFKHSEETKELCRQASLGKVHSEETCKKMSKSRMGHIVSEETKQKITNSLCKVSYKLYHISGKEVVVNNFTKFCRENKLHRERMMDRITGKVAKPYKGWTGHILKSLL
jgi:hypothetical protein